VKDYSPLTLKVLATQVETADCSPDFAAAEVRACGNTWEADLLVLTAAQRFHGAGSVCEWRRDHARRRRQGGTTCEICEALSSRAATLSEEI